MPRVSAVSVVAVFSLLACSGKSADRGVTPIPGGGGTPNSSGASGPGGSGSSTSSSANTSGAGGNIIQTPGTAGFNAGFNPEDPNAVIPSKGCGKALPPGVEPTVYAMFEVDVTGATLTDFKHPAHKRAYYVWVPADYDNTKPYRLVHVMSGCGDRYAGATATYELFNEDPQAIYVGLNMPPDGITENEGTCYNDDGGAAATEWEFFDLVNQQLDENFCVDKNRVFAAGYSSGSWVAQMFGCYFSGFDATRQFGKNLSLRGQMAVGGGLPDVPACSTKPLAAIWIDDSGSHGSQISPNLISLDRVLKLNECVGNETIVWGESTSLKSVCKQYLGCPADHPVVFCTTTGRAHESQDDNALPAFTQFAQMMNAR